jgi:hypothetical protein
MTVKTDLQSLYETDDSFWLEETIILLKEKRFQDLDVDNLIEELETLGKRDKNAVASLLEQIIRPEMLNVVTKLYIFKYSSIIKGKNVNIS